MEASGQHAGPSLDATQQARTSALPRQEGGGGRCLVSTSARSCKAAGLPILLRNNPGGGATAWNEVQRLRAPCPSPGWGS